MYNVFQFFAQTAKLLKCKATETYKTPQWQFLSVFKGF
jgi:hypothetical protein